MATLRHIGLIPDGGRRWARHHDITLRASYDVSMTKLLEWIGLAFEEDVRSVSIYMLSKANLRRSDTELDIVTEAEVAFIREAAARATSQ